MLIAIPPAVVHGGFHATVAGYSSRAPRQLLQLPCGDASLAAVLALLGRDVAEEVAAGILGHPLGRECQ